MPERIPPEKCADMASLRLEIDHLDRELMALLRRRAAYIERAIAIKAPLKLPARIEERVEEVANNARRNAEAVGFDPDMAEKIWRSLIEWSIAQEEKQLGRGEDNGRQDY